MSEENKNQEENIDTKKEATTPSASEITENQASDIEQTQVTSSQEEVVSENNDTDSVEENTDEVIIPKSKEEEEEEEEEVAIEEIDYTTLDQAQLLSHLKGLIENHNAKKIKPHVEAIKNEFNNKFNAETEQIKEKFLAEGGSIIDFYHTSSIKKEFNTLYGTFKKEQKAHFNSIKKEQEQNLIKREALVQELKSLFDNGKTVRQNYTTFRDIQDQWNEIGHIPRDAYNIVWNNYKHHRDSYYALMDLDRETRDLDHKYNLDKKLKLILRAQEIAKLEDVPKAFRELQQLHRIWKDETGPVSKEYSEKVWEEFSEYTKIVHDKKDALDAEKEKLFVVNLEKKQELINQINQVKDRGANSHKEWQIAIKEIEALREQFFKSGRVPKSEDKKIWSEFKEATREFNRAKNVFYKSQKDEQYTNLEKKKELIAVAEANKDNEDIEGTINLMKKIQSDWKKIGHVPRKDSDKIWKQFRGACNHFFDRINAKKQEANKGEVENLETKKAALDALKTLTLSGSQKEDLALIMEKVNEWKNIGRVPYKSKGIDQKFNEAIDGLFGKLDMDKKEMEMIKYENRINTILSQDDSRALRNEEFFLTKKVEETRNEMLQLQNNLEFFKHVAEDNPLVKDVHKNIAKHKEAHGIWKSKLTKLRNLSKPKPEPTPTVEEGQIEEPTTEA